MKIETLRSKLKRVYVTEADTGNEGSITIDEDLMDAAGIHQWEKVDVNGPKKRITTYVLKGKRGSGVIGMNGNAAKCFKVGDKVHVLSYCSMSRLRAILYSPVLVTTDKKNKIVDIDYIL